ncbi:type-F conjugative transfer system pilin assembly protein TrbC [Sphingomonas sp. OTU376]|uniref:type-F conjugative transfer system pilin assembly protein TrbC n=1 Tax=Sphingomonas sp. OTU376 TaxID=3043863 RepID=UPI00313E73E1
MVLMLAAGTALAQDSARQKIESTGTEASQRVERAIAGQRADRQASPKEIRPRPFADAQRQRMAEQIKAQADTPGMRMRAEKAIAAGEAQFAAQRQAMAARLRRELGLEPDEARAIADMKSNAATTAAGWVPVLFVSSSMPLPVLRAYAEQLQKVRGVLAFRGFPGGLKRAAPMAALTSRILRLDPGCEGSACAMRDVQLIVDPLLFRQHGITRVPALAMIPGDPTQAYCERDESSPRARHIVYGDAALSGLLDEYRRLGGAEEVKDAQALLRTR